MAKLKYKCEDCGKQFEKQYQIMLHVDFHRGEPVVREMGCVCGQYYDVRRGSCTNCGYIHSTGWRVINGTPIINEPVICNQTVCSHTPTHSESWTVNA